MEQLMWGAARRLAVLVGCGLAVIGPLLVRDALAHRSALVADVLAGVASCLGVLALVAILRARRFFACGAEVSPLRTDPYRHNAHAEDDERIESDRAQATRRAAGALMALAIAAAFAVVAAASR
jgi:hypothetical protein